MKPDVGRVFFHYDSDDKRVPSRVWLQTLDNHVGNVERLVRLWQREAPDTRLVLNPKTEERLFKAAKLHDVGKPDRFKIKAKVRHLKDRGDQFVGYEYSFSGHRFLAKSDDLYVQELAQGHHTYTTEDINDAIARLRRTVGDTAEHFPVDLYILEMCDQIEAEIAVRTLEGVGEGRTFMEFTISGENGNYAIDPFPFTENPIELTLEYYDFIPVAKQRAELLEQDKSKPEQLGRLLHQFTTQAFNDQSRLPIKSTKVRITPLVETSKERISTLTWDEAYKAICGFPPRDMQREVFNRIAAGQDALLFKAPTGTGKTEAVVIPALALNKRLILPLPTRSLLEDHRLRIEKYLATFSALPGNEGRAISLIVDTGEESQRVVFINGKESGRARRHLYKADVILTTLDKFLFRYFGFGDVNKSFVYPLRIGDGSRTLICFDEAHTYDGVSFINFRHLVNALYKAGQGVVVMTATMPKAYQDEIDFLEPVGSPMGTKPADKALHVIESKHDDLSDALVEEALRQVRMNGVRKIIVTTESVGFIEHGDEPTGRALRDGAYNVYVKLKQAIGADELTGFKPRENLFLYHGRMDKQERKAVYDALKKLDDDQEASYILVTTSAIEVGCDLNARMLITELCNPEQLIQRAGRCNRRGNFADAKVVVAIPKQAYGDGGLIKPYARSLTLEEEAAYVEFLKNCDGQPLNAEQLMMHIAKRPANDYRVETLFDMLGEYVYEARLENKPLYERGFIVTRSWEPSLTFEVPFNGEKHRISAQFSMCVCRKGESPNPTAQVQQMDYSHDANRESKQRLRSGPVYGKQVIVTMGQEFAYEPEYGLVDVPKIFTWKRETSESYKVLLGLVEEGERKTIVWYFRDLPDDGYFTGYVREIVDAEEQEEPSEENSDEEEEEQESS
jgi:CRISPR-associated endonuclease/helicase Cas3